MKKRSERDLERESKKDLEEMKNRKRDLEEGVWGRNRSSVHRPIHHPRSQFVVSPVCRYPVYTPTTLRDGLCRILS